MLDAANWSTLLAGLAGKRVHGAVLGIWAFGDLALGRHAGRVTPRI